MERVKGEGARPRSRSPFSAHRTSFGRREVWRIGDWGGASGQIGRRWEEVGSGALGDLVGRASPTHPEYVPRAALSFATDEACQAALHAVGLTHADAILLGSLGGRLALQPVDFKWSLEVAQRGQIGAEALQALLEADLPAVHQALESAIEPNSWEFDHADRRLPPLERLTLLNGLFLAPEHADNRAFLLSQANRHQEHPLDPRQVVFEPVNGRGFFSALPGWELGVLLAAQEGAGRALDRLEGAEYYYRLGAGVLGALLARRRSIFDTDVPKIDAPEELARLRREQRLRTTPQLVEYLRRAMAARTDLTRTFSQLGRSLYPFGAFRITLKSQGITLPHRSQASPDSRNWSRLYGPIQRELSARLLDEGRALVASGLSDVQALAALRARGPELARHAAATAIRLIGSERVVAPIGSAGEVEPEP